MIILEAEKQLIKNDFFKLVKRALGVPLTFWQYWFNSRSLKYSSFSLFCRLLGQFSSKVVKNA
jgi:hypothetical protein